MTQPESPDAESARSAEIRVETLSDAPEPMDAFRRFADLPHVMFFDTVARGGQHGRWSYLTARPVEWLSSTGGQIDLRICRSDSLEDARYEPVPVETRDVFSLLRERLTWWRTPHDPTLPPWSGGAAGLFAYGLNRQLENIPASRFDEFGCPDLGVGLYDWVLAWDHECGSCQLVARGESAARSGRTRELRRRLDGPVRPSPRRTRPKLERADLAPSWPLGESGDVLSNFRRQDYIETVARAIEYICAGDIFQVSLSQRLIHPLTGDPIEFYARLRESNPAPFAAWLDLGEHVVASSSPEQFLSLDAQGRVLTRPIKGTRSRGYTAEEDVYRRVVLSESAKDQSENVMIVDLLRNDLSRVCRPGTVDVPRLFELERHPTVHHLVSEVRGTLREDADACDLLRAAFPGGSITGAPKVRAMEIIAELEPTARGAYCGSLVWIGCDGSMGSNILIRTATLAHGWMQLPVGGGIVADSSPRAEYQETLDKAAGMVRAIEP